MPALKRLHEQFTDEGFEVLAVAMPYSKQAEISTFIQKNNIDFPVAHDRGGEMSEAFPGVRFTPTSFLIDGDGNIIWKHIGRMTPDKAAIEIVPALQPQHLAKR